MGAYALFVSMAVAFLRRPAPPAAERRARQPVPAGTRAIREIAVTIVGGYLSFLLIVLVFHVWIAGQRGALRSAAVGGGFLAFGVAAPVLIGGVWLRSWRRPGK